MADTKPPSDARVTASYAVMKPPCPACTRGRGVHDCGLASLQARFWIPTPRKEVKR